MTAETIGFDLDGVLMRNPFGSYVFPRVHELMRAAPMLQGEDVEAARTTVTSAVLGRVGELMRAGKLVEAYDWDAIFMHVATSFGGAAIPPVSQLVGEGCRAPGGIAALPGAASTLAALRAAGFRLVVVSNGFSYFQEPVLEALDLLQYFDAVITPDRVGAAKPDPLAFRAAGDLQWFVGDTLVHDVFGANGVGATSVWLDASMPASLAALPVAARSARQELTERVAASLRESMYVAFHPDAAVGNSTPAYAIRELGELLEVVGR